VGHAMIDDVMKVRLVAVSLVAALLASPVILDACLFTCHTSTSTQADEEIGAPSCHHVAGESDARFEPPPASCGHDHSPSPLTMTAKERGVDARVDAACVIVDSLAVHDPAPIEFRVADAVVPETRSGPAWSLPLRI
jgi:hypothetical protein